MLGFVQSGAEAGPRVKAGSVSKGGLCPFIQKYFLFSIPCLNGLLDRPQGFGFIP